MINWIKKNRLEFFILIGILGLALFLRLYRIGEFMTFLGDEGRDVRIVRDLITRGNLVFIGPQTSIGNMYLGPLYYYMMAPALFLSNLNPVGPAIMVALLGVLTVGLTWFVGRSWFNKSAGLVAAALFSVSPVAIIYSRSSWNPNPMPLFALLCIWGVYQVWQNKKYFWLPIVGVSFAFALQMHYLGLLLAPTLGFFWLISLLRIRKDKTLRSHFVKNTLLAIALFLVLMSPLVLFDIKHQGMNFHAFEKFFTDRQTTVNLNPTKSDRFVPVIITTVTDLVLARQNISVPLISVAILLLSVFIFFKSKWRPQLKLLYIWLAFGIFGLSIYKQHVYVHYLGFIYPAVYLLLGALIGYFLSRKGFVLKVVALLTVLALLFVNLRYSPTFGQPNRQLQRTEAAADLIIKESKGEPFNFGLIAKQNYDESYRYFLENKKANLIRGEERITDWLFVICEDGDKCQPEGNPGWQIAVFGPSHIVSEWSIDYLKIYQLAHSK
ncbi:MAG TPA: glycosyltransferase family 39 protein [Candidatus Woesebacteria bacterium]|nr:glycosyltransferase family 39 protein [Candidatus Woesebacteria bacterium]